MATSILTKKSISFLETYLNNASPTGYEWDGQKIWMDYLKPYVDEFITRNVIRKLSRTSGFKFSILNGSPLIFCI